MTNCIYVDGEGYCQLSAYKGKKECNCENTKECEYYEEEQ